MSQKLKVTVEITGTNGEIIKNVQERGIPDLEEFDSQGFRKSFDEIETAVLEARKEASDAVVSEYVSNISKKSKGAK